MINVSSTRHAGRMIFLQNHPRVFLQRAGDLRAARAPRLSTPLIIYYQLKCYIPDSFPSNARNADSNSRSQFQSPRAGRFLGHFGSFLACFGKPDCDCLLPAFYDATLSSLSRMQCSAFFPVQCAFDPLTCGLPVSSHDFLPSRSVAVANCDPYLNPNAPAQYAAEYNSLAEFFVR